jgi:hypothetical protein
MGTEVVIHKQKDRVQVSVGKTINCGNFESIRIDATFASDVRKGEELKDAWERVESEVENELAKMTGEAQPKKKGK